MDTISILAALDENYLPQLQVMIISLYMNNPGERVRLYLLYSFQPTVSCLPPITHNPLVFLYSSHSA